MKLVTFNYNWAYEIDFEGFALLNEQKCKNLENAIDKYFKNNATVNLYFGSNEDGEFTKDDILDGMTISDITDTEYNTLYNLFGNKFGYILEEDNFEVN